jgi:hypothetical protein
MSEVPSEEDTRSHSKVSEAGVSSAPAGDPVTLREFNFAQDYASVIDLWRITVHVIQVRWYEVRVVILF